jgi:hypothetical protein
MPGTASTASIQAAALNLCLGDQALAHLGQIFRRRGPHRLERGDSDSPLSASICIPATSVRQACSVAERHIRDLRYPGAMGFDISGATPETVSLIRSYLSSLRVEILTDLLLRNVGEF